MINHVQNEEAAAEPVEDNICVEEPIQKPAIEIQSFRDIMLKELKEKADQYLKNVIKQK